MAIELTDDGTLDTVLRCSECGEEFRFNYDDSQTSQDDIDADCAEVQSADPKRSMAEIIARYPQRAYDAFVESCIEEIEVEHECASDEPTEPEESDITTENHINFYQDGKLVLERAGTLTGDFSDEWYWYADKRCRVLGSFGDDHIAALKAYMQKTQFFPNCWLISDHGNAHLMNLGE